MIRHTQPAELDFGPIRPARMARRMLAAARTDSLESLRAELNKAEDLSAYDEERLELLSAIAQDMNAAIETSADAPLTETFGAHMELLRHLACAKVWVN